MAKSRPSVQKRRNEAAKLEKKQLKMARKSQREAMRAQRGQSEDGIDPDLAGIVAGPQPVQDDGYEGRVVEHEVPASSSVQQVS